MAARLGLVIRLSKDSRTFGGKGRGNRLGVLAILNVESILKVTKEAPHSAEHVLTWIEGCGSGEKVFNVSDKSRRSRPLAAQGEIHTFLPRRIVSPGDAHVLKKKVPESFAALRLGEPQVCSVTWWRQNLRKNCYRYCKPANTMSKYWLILTDYYLNLDGFVDDHFICMF